MKKYFDSLGKEIIPFKGSEIIQENPPIYAPGTLISMGKPLPCFDDEWKPIRCPFCSEDSSNHDGELFTAKPKAFDGSIVLEADIICKTCGDIITHWAYGYYEPQKVK